jgi:dihydrofolate reductase
MDIKIILLSDLVGNIGKNNELIYKFKKDFKRFKELTEGCSVVMGRKTWESLPKKLVNRKNLVLSRRGGEYIETKTPDCYLDNIDEIISYSKYNNIWIIGGSSLYSVMFKFADEVYHTVVNDICSDSDVQIDNLYEELGTYFKLDSSEVVSDVDLLSGVEYDLDFRKYVKKL